jgi:hypothetical protein
MIRSHGRISGHRHGPSTKRYPVQGALSARPDLGKSASGRRLRDTRGHVRREARAYHHPVVGALELTYNRLDLADAESQHATDLS